MKLLKKIRIFLDDYYIIECPKQTYARLSFGIINPFRNITIFAIWRETTGGVAIAICNIEVIICL